MQHPLLNNPVRFELVLRAADVAMLAATGVLASLLHFHSLPGAAAPVHLVLLYLCSFAVFVLFGKARLYPPACGRPSLRLAVTLAACWGFVLLLGLLFAFLIHQVAFLSRGWLGA
ncbi:MAG TPA: undecaprenyl-phosphate glucose phosphotransferase, partial [Telluria sp.]|nr:undecaprenyl-phosphate glucose phosphotransferase [Telluria sp.]